MGGPTSLGRELFPNRPWLSAFTAILAGILLPLSLAPFDFWWSGFISLMLLLAVLRGASFRQALLRWYLFGIGQFLLGASWVYVSINTHGGASIGLAGLLVGLFVAGISLVVLLQGYVYQRFFACTELAWVVAFPALWVFKEWTTTWLLSGFPWSLLGYGQLHSPLAGFAPVIGVLGIGFVVALIAALFFAGVLRSGTKRYQWWGGGVGIMLLGSALNLATFNQPIGEPIQVSLIQGNVAQETKWRQEMVEPIISQYLTLSEKEWGRDLIVWPEASITLFADTAMNLLDGLDSQGKRSGSALLLGIPTRDSQSYYNSAMVVGEGSGTYIKRHLVPFGEYVPLEELFRGAIEFLDLPMSRNRPGPDGQVLMNVQGLSVALSICYEIAFPDLVRRDALESAFLVTISNDTWFGKSLGPHQHMQMAQMRALENARFVVRATNNGVTAVVDHRGRIQKRLPQFEAGVLRAAVVPMNGATPYSRVGDWPLLLGLALLLSLMLIRGYRVQSHLNIAASRQ